MIKYFRKIRQRLLTENKFSKYLLYAIGEIVLVVIGILIALWLNNLNQERTNNEERRNLKIALKAELFENKEFFNSYKIYAEECGKKTVTILNVSAGANSKFPLDTLRKYAIDMMPFRAFAIDESRRNSAKSAGQLKLLNSMESTALAEYETILENYKEARKVNTIWKENNRILFIYLASFDMLNKRDYDGTILLNHPDYVLSDEEFLTFLKKKDTYAKLKDIFISTEVDVRWLDAVIKTLDETIEALN